MNLMEITGEMVLYFYIETYKLILSQIEKKFKRFTQKTYKFLVLFHFRMRSQFNKFIYQLSDE